MRVRLQKGYILRDVQPYYEIYMGLDSPYQQLQPVARVARTCYWVDCYSNPVTKEQKIQEGVQPVQKAYLWCSKPTCLLKWL